MRFSNTALVSLAVAAAGLPSLASADIVQVQVTVENLAPAGSVATGALRVGFGNGTFDAFNAGMAPTAAIIPVAELGSGSAWFPAFMAAEPGATLGSVAPNPAGPLPPGGTASATFMVDRSANRYFSFGAMVVPSNDYFIGNDSPTDYQLFDMMGNLNFSAITLSASDVWDAGSEQEGVFGAAFIAGSSAMDHVDENGLTAHDFAGLGIFNGLTTGAGYPFNLQLTANSDLYRISFAVVPEPTAMLLLALSSALAIRRR